jgi:phospholipid/cholesterol/gamma-HCH transport system substrate-binding protein
VPDGRQYALQIRIGVFVVLALGVFVAIIVLLGAQARLFERKYDLFAEFTEVGGLLDGATVRLGGVQVGRVTRVELPPEVGGKVRVKLAVTRRFQDRIRQDSVARIVTQGLLGDRLVEISLGSAAAPPVEPGGTLRSEEPFEFTRAVAEGSDTLAGMGRLARSVEAALERLNRSDALADLEAALGSARRLAASLERLERDGAVRDLVATARAARRIAGEIEGGRGWLHALIYDEPQALHRLDGLLRATQELVARADRGEGAVSALLAPESGRAVRSFLRTMEAVERTAARVARGLDPSGDQAGLLAALLYDPEYRAAADDLRRVARSLREVSEGLVHGRGLLGSLLREPAEGPLGEAVADFGAAMANLRALTERIERGEGTIGGLLEDPTVYENLAQFLEGAQRSFLLRMLIRSAIGAGAKAGAAGASRGAAEERK